MFEAHFGFRENPFKLDHDLSYLFWGRHQEEVIAHLHYAVMEGEGFIAITGELGVGKTMVCRSFIENLGPDVTAAYIDNPVGSSEELLKSLNKQFGIRYGARSTMALTDALNTFLMQTKLAGKKVAVFIDDAQLLQKDTLEQVRLISNLETSRDKLIQIVLVGEPELTEMLASYDLRQIGQRVSVKYHIGPFNLAETIAYIQHRLAIASKMPAAPFDQRAYRHIFRFSGGNPRAINIACNRALTTAFHRKETRITGELAEEVVGHLTGRGEKTKLEYFRRRRIGWMAAGTGILLAFITAAYFLQPNRFEASKGQAKPQQHETAELSVPKSTEAPAKMASADKAATRAAEETSLPREALPPVESPKRAAMEPSPPRETLPPAESPGRPAVEPSPVRQTPPPEMTYSVQVGAFLEMDNAKELAGQLTAKGYPAKIVTVQDSKNRSWHTVRIGDYGSKREAQIGADEFSALEKMETAVRPFKKL